MTAAAKTQRRGVYMRGQMRGRWERKRRRGGRDKKGRRRRRRREQRKNGDISAACEREKKEDSTPGLSDTEPASDRTD